LNSPVCSCVSIGNSNTAIGFQALYSNTSGFWNTATGDQALYSNGISKAAKV